MLEFLNQAIHPFTWAQLASAIFCGFAFGLERQIRGRPVGVRTAIMICLGSEIFVQLGSSIDLPGTDPTRVLGQIINGIGFLGAGVMLARGSYVLGVTSASIIWMISAVGAVIGLNHVLAALTITITSIIVLLSFEILEKYFDLPDGGRKGPRGKVSTPSD